MLTPALCVIAYLVGWLYGPTLAVKAKEALKNWERK